MVTPPSTAQHPTEVGSDRPFRFGVTATPQGDGDAWGAQARRVAELGYSTLLMPDVVHLLAPFPSLAVAASAAPQLRVGTYVLASPLRPARSAAWEAHTLSVLTGGRFELGIGTGLPDLEPTVRDLGLPYGTPAERLAQVAATIDRLRELDGDRRTPVLVAAGGPQARQLAATAADIVTLAIGPLASRADVATLVADVRHRAGARADQLEFLTNLFVVGEELPTGLGRFIGADIGTLIEHDSLVMLRGEPRTMAYEVRRRRDTLGISYLTVNATFAERFAPVVEMLDGS
jgi:alkanesulfonate monooxygenase SsuD/methylene tetrahydromethanopterin reductase-like flavin-dependent oxidoreductase (luciferase family)